VIVVDSTIPQKRTATKKGAESIVLKLNWTRVIVPLPQTWSIIVSIKRNRSKGSDPVNGLLRGPVL
jgi:hypothetical protein